MRTALPNAVKEELHSNYIFSSFCLNCPRMGFYNPIYKNELFYFQNSHLNTICTRYIMAFYLLT